MLRSVWCKKLVRKKLDKERMADIRLRARDESALEVAPPDRRLDRRPTAFTTMRYTNRQPLPLPLPLHSGFLNRFLECVSRPGVYPAINEIYYKKKCVFIRWMFRLANLFYSSINLTPELQVTRRKTVTLVSDLVRVLDCNVCTRGVQKFRNSIWGRNGISKIFTLFVNIIALNSNTYVTYVKKLFYASQMKFWWHAVQIRLSTQWPAWSHCHHGTTSSDDEIDRRHWVLGLLSRVGMTTIPIKCSLLQPAEQEHGSKMMTRSSRPLSHTWRACNKNSIWLASKSFLVNVTYLLLPVRVIMLNNNITILLVSFVRHIELQNFLNVPRVSVCPSASMYFSTRL